jgi:hypothetical protein
MKKNVGGTDKVIRIVLGLVIIALGLIYQSWWGLIGIVPLLTASINWCPVYVPMGISTNKSATEEKK